MCPARKSMIVEKVQEKFPCFGNCQLLYRGEKQDSEKSLVHEVAGQDLNPLSMGAVVIVAQRKAKGQLGGGGFSGEVVCKVGLLGYKKGKEGHPKSRGLEE